MDAVNGAIQLNFDACSPRCFFANLFPGLDGPGRFVLLVPVILVVDDSIEKSMVLCGGGLSLRLRRVETSPVKILGSTNIQGYDN